MGIREKNKMGVKMKGLSSKNKRAVIEGSEFFFIFFFFSSRRRHTRLVSDWSSDVCSSDLGSMREKEKKNDGIEPNCEKQGGNQEEKEQQEKEDRKSVV